MKGILKSCKEALISSSLRKEKNKRIKINFSFSMIIEPVRIL